MMHGREATEYSTCSPTVPSGDTPCLTAGDARRVNPWSGDAAPSPTPAVSHSIHFRPPESLPPRYEISTKNEIFFCYAKRLHNPFLTLHRQTKGRTSERLKAAHSSCGWSRKLPPPLKKWRGSSIGLEQLPTKHQVMGSSPILVTTHGVGSSSG